MKINTEQHSTLIEYATSELLNMSDNNVVVSYSVTVYTDQTCALCADVESTYGTERMVTLSVNEAEKVDEFLEKVEDAKKNIIKARRDSCKKERDRIMEQVEHYNRVLLRMEDSYEGKQAYWAWKNNIETGTKARVMRTYTEGERGYHKEEDGILVAINEVGTIVGMDKNGVVLKLVEGSEVSLPYFILDIVKE